MRPAPAVHARPSALSRFFRNPDTGVVVVMQPPNLPLWVFLAATALRLLFHPEGAAGTVVSIVSTVAILVWALIEIVAGSSPFRRVLGGVVLVAVVVGLLLR